MASLEILDRTGKKVGSYDIDPAVFSSHINRQLLHDVVVMYQANQRQGTMKTKSRGQVAGSGKKMYRQKGTGNARAGGRRSPVRVGGGHTFRKDPREFRYALPRKAMQLATRMAIASKIRDNQVTVIDDLKFDAPRTKDMAALIKAVKCGGGSLLRRRRRDGCQCLQEHSQYRQSRNRAGQGFQCILGPAAQAAAVDQGGVGCLEGKCRKDSEVQESAGRGTAKC